MGIKVQRYSNNDNLEFFKAVVGDIAEEREFEARHTRNDFLSVLLDARHDKTSDGVDDTELTMEYVLANTIVFFIGGYETISTALEWTFYCIANNENAQTKLFEEINSHIQDEHDITYDTVNSLPYLNSVINETLRMYPPSSGLNRTCNTDTTINGIKMSKDDWVIISSFSIHYNEQYWPEPHKFRPERFMADERASITPYSYLPWGDGPRNCVGQHLAYLVMKIAVVHTVRQFKLTVDTEKTQMPIMFARGFGRLEPKEPIYLNFEKRQH